MFGTKARKNKLNSGLSASSRHSDVGYQSLVTVLSEPDSVSRHFLKGFLSYLGGLYSEGEISEQAYYALVNRAVALSAEAMTVQKVQSLIEKYEDYFERATEEYFAAK